MRAFYFREIRKDDSFANIKHCEYLCNMHLKVQLSIETQVPREYKMPWISTWYKNQKIKTPQTKEGLQFITWDQQFHPNFRVLKFKFSEYILLYKHT